MTTVNPWEITPGSPWGAALNGFNSSSTDVPPVLTPMPISRAMCQFRSRPKGADATLYATMDSAAFTTPTGVQAGTISIVGGNSITLNLPGAATLAMADVGPYWVDVFVWFASDPTSPIQVVAAAPAAPAPYVTVAV